MFYLFFVSFTHFRKYDSVVRKTNQNKPTKWIRKCNNWGIKEIWKCEEFNGIKFFFSKIFKKKNNRDTYLTTKTALFYSFTFSQAILNRKYKNYFIITYYY